MTTTIRKNHAAPPLALLKPVVAPFIRRLLGPDAPYVDTLQPEETVSVRPPALLAGMLDRVTGTDEHSDLSFHIGAATQTRVVHAPVIRKTFRGVTVSRNGFATWRYRERYSRSQTTADLRAPLISVQSLRYCHSQLISRHFGHWLMDGVPTALIEPEAGDLWMPSHPDWIHAADYQHALNLSVRDEPLLHAEQLICYQDYGQGSHKQARYSAIRDRLQALFGDGRADDFVYIQRGRTGSPRWIRDEEALIEALTVRGWKVVDVATASVSELQQTLCRARVVVSIEGSHLNHAQLSLLPKSVLVVLAPHDRFTTNHLGRCRAHGVSPGLVVLLGSQSDGYQVDLGEILRTVDLAIAGADT